MTWNGSGNTCAEQVGVTVFTGGVVLNSGTLSISSGPNLGAAPASPSAQLKFAGNSTLQFSASIFQGSAINTNRGFLINNGVTATIDTQGFTIYTNNGVSAQSGQTGVLNKIGNGTLALGNNNGNDRDDAFLTVQNTAGTLILNKASNSGLHAVGGGGLTVAAGVVSLGGSGGDQIYDAAPVAVTGGTFDTSGNSETIGT